MTEAIKQSAGQDRVIRAYYKARRILQRFRGSLFDSAALRIGTHDFSIACGFGATPHHLFDIASVTKAFLAAYYLERRDTLQQALEDWQLNTGDNLSISPEDFINFKVKTESNYWEELRKQIGRVPKQKLFDLILNLPVIRLDKPVYTDMPYMFLRALMYKYGRFEDENHDLLSDFHDFALTRLYIAPASLLLHPKQVMQGRFAPRIFAGKNSIPTDPKARDFAGSIENDSGADLLGHAGAFANVNSMFSLAQFWVRNMKKDSTIARPLSCALSDGIDGNNKYVNGLYISEPNNDEFAKVVGRRLAVKTGSSGSVIMFDKEGQMIIAFASDIILKNRHDFASTSRMRDYIARKILKAMSC